MFKYLEFVSFLLIHVNKHFSLPTKEHKCTCVPKPFFNLQFDASLATWADQTERKKCLHTGNVCNGKFVESVCCLSVDDAIV